MVVEKPKFYDSPYFYIDKNGWHIKEGAPKETLKEFENFNARYKEYLENLQPNK